MGQLVGVVEKPSATPGMVRFELNRNLSGSGHERFGSAADAVGPRPAANLARRLFGTGKVAGVHVYMNVVTVDLNKGFTADGLSDVVRNMYQYWKPGMELPTFEDLVPDEPAAVVAAPSADGGPALDPRVPAHLWERSKLGMERWRANHS